MRKLMITAVAAAVALGPVAACSSGGSADQTREVCVEAIAAGTTASAAIQAKVNEGSQAVASGDQAKLLQIAADLRKTASDWSAKLTELSQKQIKPEVKTALTESAATISNLADPTKNVAASEAQTKLIEIGTKINAACA